MCSWEPVCVSECVPEGSVVFFPRYSPPGLLTRRAARTLADGECWQGPRPHHHTPAASRQSSTQPQGAFLGHMHLTQGAGRQVSLKHTAGALINPCRYTLITTDVDTGSPDCEVANISSVLIHFGPSVTFLGQYLSGIPRGE